jgi:hypothetical protein
MPQRPALIITTLAEYQTRFWVLVAGELDRRGVAPRFVSFDDRSTEMIARAGFPVVSANAAEAVADKARQAEIFRRVGVEGLAFWTSHERFAFGRTDTAAMREKLARSILVTEQAIAEARAQHSSLLMLQELGGFLSVIGSFFAARTTSIDHWFVEPSFFRGRMMLRRSGFGAPRFAKSDNAPAKALCAYLDRTLEQGSIVIPRKDAHQYRPVVSKVLNGRNAIRLAEKLRDKYLFGKRQEFGFIGNQVSTHLGMIRNAKRLRKHYTALEAAGRFVYYPLHVPGDMALTIRSPEYLDQIALVDFLCRVLPDNCRLAVKEHPAMVGGVAAERIIELLKRYDNLVLLDPTSNNYAVMRQAECIVTVNSKSGAEAGLLGKRVFVLGDAFYRDAPFATAVDKLGDLGAMLADALDAIDGDLAAPAHLDWFAGVWEQTLPGELYVADGASIEEFAGSVLGLFETETSPPDQGAGSRPS